MNRFLDSIKQPIDRAKYKKYPILLFVAILVVPLFWSTAARLGADAQPQDGSGAAWVPIGLFVFIGYLLLAMVVSIILTILSALRKEKLWILRVLIYIVYGVPILACILLLLISLIMMPFRG
jgi:hypothetical protein